MAKRRTTLAEPQPLPSEPAHKKLKKIEVLSSKLLPIKAEGLQAVCVSPGKRWLAAVRQPSSRIEIYDCANEFTFWGELLPSNQSISVTSLHFISLSQLEKEDATEDFESLCLLSTGHHGEINIWDTRSLSVRDSFPIGDSAGGVCVSCVSPTETAIILGCFDGSIRKVNIEKKKSNTIVLGPMCEKIADHADTKILSLCFYDDVTYFVGSSDSAIYKHEIGSRSAVGRMFVPRTTPSTTKKDHVKSLKRKAEGLIARLAREEAEKSLERSTAKLDEETDIYRHGMNIQTAEKAESQTQVFALVCLPPKFGTLISGDSLGNVIFWDIKTCTVRRSLQRHYSTVLSLFHISTTAQKSKWGEIISSGADGKLVRYARPDNGDWMVNGERTVHLGSVPSVVCIPALEERVKVVSAGSDGRVGVTPLEAFSDLDMHIEYISSLSGALSHGYRMVGCEEADIVVAAANSAVDIWKMASPSAGETEPNKSEINQLVRGVAEKARREVEIQKLHYMTDQKIEELIESRVPKIRPIRVFRLESKSESLKVSVAVRDMGVSPKGNALTVLTAEGSVTNFEIDFESLEVKRVTKFRKENTANRNITCVCNLGDGKYALGWWEETQSAKVKKRSRISSSDSTTSDSESTSSSSSPHEDDEEDEEEVFARRGGVSIWREETRVAEVGGLDITPRHIIRHSENGTCVMVVVPNGLGRPLWIRQSRGDPILETHSLPFSVISVCVCPKYPEILACLNVHGDMCLVLASTGETRTFSGWRHRKFGRGQISMSYLIEEETHCVLLSCPTHLKGSIITYKFKLDKAISAMLSAEEVFKALVCESGAKGAMGTIDSMMGGGAICANVCVLPGESSNGRILIARLDVDDLMPQDLAIVEHPRSFGEKT